MTHQCVPYRPAKLLTLNESLVLLSGCLQMMPVTSMQRRTEPVMRKTAHSVPSARASLASTATMHTMMIRTAKREKKKSGENPHMYHVSPQIFQKETVSVS